MQDVEKTQDVEKRSMTEQDQVSGITLICSPDGTIKEVVRNDLALEHKIAPGTRLSAVVDPGSREKSRLFLDVLRQERAAFNWHLNLATQERLLPLYFAGGASDNELLIVGATTLSGIVPYFETVTNNSNGQSNALRAAMRGLTYFAQSHTQSDSYLNELTSLNNELATLQRELTKKNIELERLNKQKNQLLGMAAHDLRNPLGVIAMLSKFLRNRAADKLDQQELELIEQIRSSSQFMLNLVNDLLDISKIEAGRLELSLKQQNLVSVLEQNISLNRLLAESRGVRLTLHCAVRDLDLMIDRAKFEQVLNNLITNAVKFSPDNSEVVVDVSLENDEVIIAVRDRGIGIPAQEFERIFDPFEKVSSQSPSGEKGTGLGLAIAKKIVLAHRGRIWVESQLDQGTTFFVALPLPRAQERQLAS